MAIRRSIGYRNADTRWSTLDGGTARDKANGGPGTDTCTTVESAKSCER